MGTLASILADTPLGYWPLDDPSSSGNVCTDHGSVNQQLSWHGTRTATTFHDGSRASTFSGDDYAATLGDLAAYNLNGISLTLELFIRYSGVSTVLETPIAIRHSGGASSTQQALILLNNGVSGRVQLYDGSTAVTWDGALNDGQWHQIAVVMPTGSAAQQIFADGALKASTTFTRAVPTISNRSVYVGANWTGTVPNQIMTADIAHAAVYGSALSGTRLLAHYTEAMASLSASHWGRRLV